MLCTPVTHLSRAQPQVRAQKHLWKVRWKKGFQVPTVKFFAIFTYLYLHSWDSNPLWNTDDSFKWWFINSLFQMTLAAWNLGCHSFRHFHCHVTRIVIIRQRWWQTQQKSNNNTAVAGRFFSLFLTPPNMQIQSCRHCYHQLMLLIPECQEQNQGITFPSGKIDSAQNSETPELLEVLNTPKKQQNGTLCWVDLGSHPPCKQQNCPSLFHW